MAKAVTIVAAGGIGVTNLDVLSGFGAAMTPVSSGGQAVTLVPSGGQPVVLINEDGSLFSNLGGVTPYHYWDFINDRALFASADVGPVASTPGWSFSRASTGYYTNADGTLTSFASGALRRGNRGVLIEGARTNLCLRSQAWGTSPWGELLGGSGATVTGDAAAAPDGTSTATRITFLTQFGGPKQDISTTNAVTYTWSFWAKRESGNTALHLYHNDSATSATTAFTVTDQWARYSVSVLGKSGSGNVTFGVQDRNASGQGSILVWGAQLEAASFPSSYIPTTSASATRAADVLTVSSPGVDFPLTLFAEFERAVDTGGSEVVFNVNRGTLLNESFIHINSADQVSGWTLDGAGTTADDPVTGACAIGTAYKGAARLATNDVKAARNGTLSTGDTSCAMPTTPTALHFGVRYDGVSPLFGYLRRAAIFNSAVNDAGLQAMTT